MLANHRSDQLIDAIKGMLYHSFVLNVMKTTALDTMAHFEELVEEHRRNPETSRLKAQAPSVGKFFTSLPLRQVQ